MSSSKDVVIKGEVTRRDFRLSLDLELRAGETTAVVGPNGAGKTTLVELLCGLVALDAGKIVCGKQLWDGPHAGGGRTKRPKGRVFVPPQSRHCGVVFQRYRLFPHLNVADNIAFGLRFGHAGSATKSLDELLESFGLCELAKRFPTELSGGQAQRVAIARAFAFSPKLLALDEPLAALDTEVKAEIRELLAAVLPTVSGPRIVVSHSAQEVEALGQAVVLLQDGQARKFSSLSALKAQNPSPWVTAFCLK